MRRAISATITSQHQVPVWLADNGTNFMVVGLFPRQHELNVYLDLRRLRSVCRAMDLAEALIPGVSSCSALPLPPYQVCLHRIPCRRRHAVAIGDARHDL